MLIGDTTTADVTLQVFQDNEIDAALEMTSSAFLYVSGQAQAGGVSVVSPPTVYSIWRAAATLLRSISSVKARGSIITQLLDVKLSPKDASMALKDLAQSFMDMEDSAFAIAESVVDVFSERERITKQFQRLYG